MTFQSMLNATIKPCKPGGIIVATILAIAPGIGAADILWSGDYASGNFKQWHKEDSRQVTFWQVPTYGRPIQYGGQVGDHVGKGDLLQLVAATSRTVNGVFYPAGPTRGNSKYAAKFTVKNFIDGQEPGDCDYGKCDRRRTEVTVQQTLQKYYNAMP